jgi:hypothetical protein
MPHTDQKMSSPHTLQVACEGLYGYQTPPFAVLTERR